MAKYQPDFNAIFTDALGGPPEAIRYELRDGPCLPHDLAFLSSLLHDARVLNPGDGPNDGVLAIETNRDCWELGYTKHERSLELHIADSVLTCAGVASVSWRLGETPAEQPWINYLWIDRSYREHDAEQFQLLLAGEDWECDAMLKRDEWSVELRDREIPYLWSERHPK